jgi:hypothetical protein
MQRSHRAASRSGVDSADRRGGRFKCVGLLQDQYVAILSSDYPIADEPELSIESIASLPHINITSSGDNIHFIDDILCRAWSRGVRYRNGINTHSL